MEETSGAGFRGSHHCGGFVTMVGASVVGTAVVGGKSWPTNGSSVSLSTLCSVLRESNAQ